MLYSIFIHFFFYIAFIYCILFFFFFQAEDGIRDYKVTGVQTCALPILWRRSGACPPPATARPGFSVSGRSCVGSLLACPLLPAAQLPGAQHPAPAHKIGRASCRERV